MGERERAVLGAGGVPGGQGEPRVERVEVVGQNIKYKGERGLPGLYIGGAPFSPDKSYFEIEIEGAGLGEVGGGGPVIGLCSHRYPTDLLPGWTAESVGYHTGDGKLYKVHA